MFNQFSYKTKFKALLVIFCLLGTAAYKRSFSTLFTLIKENRSLSENSSNSSDNKSVNIFALTNQLKEIDKIIGTEGLDKEIIQKNIIDFATHNSHGVSIFSLEPIHEFTDETFKVYTNQLDITGNFNQLLSLSYKFEKEFNDSKIVSQQFYTISKYNSPKTLHLKIIFQNYENN